MECLDEIICNAKKCSVEMGAKYAHDFKYGELSEELKWNFLKLNGFIRTLLRNQGTIKYKKELGYPTTVSIDSLTKKKSFLYLRCEQRIICTKTKISPCLSDSEINDIVEQIKLLCSSCNCNCI